MTSAADAIEQASYSALTAGASIGADVFQHVPEDTAPPVVIIGDIETTPLGTKDGDRLGALVILTVTAAEERKPCLAIMAQIEDRLDAQTITVAGWTLTFSFNGDNAVLTPEGDGYVGTSNFTILATRA